MAKTYITSGTGASQTLDAIQNEKVPVYDSKADAESDIANIEENGIVFTKDTGASEKVVDVVEDGNMNPVTSNAVADVMSGKLNTKEGIGNTIADAFDNADIQKDSVRMYGICGYISTNLIPAMGTATVGMYNLNNGGPTFCCIVQKQTDDYYSVFAFSYSTGAMYLFRHLTTNYLIREMN